MNVLLLMFASDTGLRSVTLELKLNCVPVADAPLVSPACSNTFVSGCFIL